MGDWTFYVTYLDSIKNVTAEDIQNVVKKYFVDEKSTVGYFIPKSNANVAETGSEGGQSRSSSHDKHFYRNQEHFEEGLKELYRQGTDSQSQSSEIHLSDNITQKEVASIDVITATTGVEQVVTFKGSFAAGDSFSPEENPVIADLTGNMLDKGTTQHNKFEIAEMLANMGAELSFSVDDFNLAFTGKCLNKDFDKVIEILAEQLRNPAFSEEEFTKLVEQRKGNFQQQMESTNARAGEMLNKLIFPEDHPNNGSTLQELIDALDKVTLDDVKEFFSKYYGPKSMIFVAVGDIEPGTVESAIASNFEGWSGGIDYPEIEAADETENGQFKIVKMEDKTSATLQVGMSTGLIKTSEDYLPFYLGNDILGHPGGFSGRLMSIIRDDEGLTYGIYSWHTSDIFADGKWVVQGAFAPQLLEQGIESTMREIKRWVEEGVTEEELNKAKERLSGIYKVQLATTNGLASQLLSFAQRGYDVSYIDQYPQDIQAVKLEDVNSAIKKYIDPDKAVKVIAGTVENENVLSMETE